MRWCAKGRRGRRDVGKTHFDIASDAFKRLVDKSPDAMCKLTVF